MKLIIYYLLFIFLIVSTGHVFAQVNYFTVLATRGNIYCLNDTASKPVQVKIGERILEGDTINLRDSSYVGLANNTGQTLEIERAGSYSFARLMTIIDSNYESSGKRFVTYVLEGVIKKAENIAQMKSLGAVVRKQENEISIGVPFKTLIIDSSITFKWFGNQDSDGYIFKLFNSSGVTLFMQKLDDTTITFPLNQFHLDRDEYYKWMVSDYKHPDISSDTNFIMIPSPYELESIKDTIKELKTTFEDTTSALGYFVSALFYQRNQLNLKALDAYRKAIHYAPLVNIYKKSFSEFLINMRLYNMVESDSTGR